MNSQHLSATAYCTMYAKKTGRVYNISKHYWANKKYLGTLHSDSLYNDFKTIFLIFLLATIIPDISEHTLVYNIKYYYPCFTSSRK